MIVDAYAEPAAMAERAGVILGIENEHACCLGTGAQTARVLEEIASPSVRAIWDPGNAFMAGEQPYPGRLRGDQRVYRPCPYQRCDCGSAGAPAPEWTVVGRARLTYAGQLAALKAGGYAGWLSLETHYSGHSAPEMSAKEASSRACLEGLQRLMAGLRVAAMIASS